MQIFCTAVFIKSKSAKLAKFVPNKNLDKLGVMFKSSPPKTP
jgi:hypothetical protein